MNKKRIILIAVAAVIIVGGGSKWSENMTFTTSQPGADTTRFFVIGDTQLSGNVESDQDEIRLMNAIAANINGQSMNFGIQTGDFVDNGGNLGQWSEILDVFSRNYADIPVVQVTGSAGKTTTKEMIASVLSRHFRTLKTQANLNNHIGTPQTLLRLEPCHQAAVIETGMDHFGQIRYMGSLVP